MLRPEIEKWQQSVADLRRLALEAEHPRSRERFQALYMIASQQSNASRWSLEIGRKNQTVMSWVHTYNEGGPEALAYRRSGGRPPFLSRRKLMK